MTSNPFIWEIINALIWGPPYYPEIGVGLSIILCLLWLALRVSVRKKRLKEENAPSSVEVAKKDGSLYEDRVADAIPPRVQTDVAEVETPPGIVPPAKKEKPEHLILPREEKPKIPPREDIVAPPMAVEPTVAEREEEAEIIHEEPPIEDFFTRLKRGLKKTQENFLGKVDALLRGGAKLDDDSYEELEEALITADLGVDTATKLLDKIQKEGERGKLKNPKSARELLRNEILKILEKVDNPLQINYEKPFVIMVLGVNGVGKTTTIAKLAYRFREEGKKVLLAAGDTFRAAAVEQLGIWAKRVGADFVKHSTGSDPSAVAFDALKAAKSRNVDIVIVDTAGRLHTRVPLMEELKKVKRVIAREVDAAPHETLLVLDSTTGQNALSQAQAFHEAVGITGIVMTKLDSSAKGGVIVALSDKFNIPIRFVGIGEKMYDLTEFKAKPFVDALFE